MRTIPTEIREDRFAFERAEEVLVAFSHTVRSHQFRRSWRLLELILHALACADHRSRGVPEQMAMARAWEDLQVAFIGHGEPALTGAVLQLWVHVESGAEGNRFARAITAAFEWAE